MAKLNVTPLPLKTFTRNPTKGTLVAEASDFNNFRPSRLNNDSYDVGIAILSHHTNDTRRFVLTRLIPMGDELGGWEFVPEDGKGAVKLVTIFND